MDDSRFDDITKVLAAPSRRSLVAALSAAALSAWLGWDEHEAGAGPNKNKKKKKKNKGKNKPCPRNCVGKNCGDDDGCGRPCITDLGCDAGKKCSDAGECVLDICGGSCDGKVCGADDGCGRRCISDLGCDTGKSCSQDGECVPDICMPTCVDKSCGDNDGCGGTCQTSQGCEEGKGCCPDGCVDLLNDPRNCTYCGYDCAAFGDGSDDCCCQGACMPPGSQFCTCDCCRIDDDEESG